MILSPWLNALSERITREQIIRLAKAAPAEPESFWRAFIVGLAREGQKFKRYGKLALIALVISLVFGFIPGVAPITWATITAWWLTFEYADYFSDNVGEPLGTTLRLMHEHKRLSIGFGFTALLGTMIPVVNLLIVPACLTGATLWRIAVSQSQNYVVFAFWIGRAPDENFFCSIRNDLSPTLAVFVHFGAIGTA